MREQGGHVTLASPVNLARSTAAALPRLIQDSARGVLVLGAPALFSWAGDDLWSRRWALTSPGWGNLGLTLFAWGFTAEAPSVWGRWGRRAGWAGWTGRGAGSAFRLGAPRVEGSPRRQLRLRSHHSVTLALRVVPRRPRVWLFILALNVGFLIKALLMLSVCGGLFSKALGSVA